MGWNDSPLTEEGIVQLSAMNLDESQYDWFISSDSNRCLQTMKLLLPAIQPESFPEFREMNFGDFQGKTYEELQNEESYRLWLSDFTTYSPPRGESFKEFTERIHTGWERVVQQQLQGKGRNIFIVTHGGVIKYLLSKYAPDKKEFWEWNVSHGGGYELRWNNEQLRRGGRCISLREVPLTGNENG